MNYGGRKKHREQFKDRKRTLDLMLGWNEIIEQLAMANSIHWYAHVLRRGLSHHEKGIRF